MSDEQNTVAPVHAPYTICPFNLLSAITERIKLHHKLYKNLPIKDKYWEYVLANSYNDINVKCEWTEDSHDVGKDITIEHEKYKKISCKSGILICSKRQNKIKKLKISSYRTTSLPLLEDKLNYIDSNHEDIIFSLSSTLFKEYEKYVLTIFTPPVFKDMTWEKNDTGYVAKSDTIIAKISTQCSDQLWYEINYDCPLILEKYVICLN